MKEVNTNKKSGLKIKNKKRFFTFITVLLLIIIVCIIAICNRKIKIDESTDMSALNAKKYETELLEKYQGEDAKERFVQDIYNIQEKVGMYILENSTLDENSFSNIIDTLNKEFASNNFEIIEMEKPTFWNGTWNVDIDGNITFKFADKSIEPSWINDDDIAGRVIKN